MILLPSLGSFGFAAGRTLQVYGAQIGARAGNYLVQVGSQVHRINVK